MLEGRAFLHALSLRRRAAAGDDCRFVHGLDSYVVLGALAKGRTSSRLLRPIVCKSGALQVAYGQYAGLLFCPTRLNASDDPTRLVPLRAPVPHSCLNGLLFRASTLPPWSLYPVSCLVGL